MNPPSPRALWWLGLFGLLPLLDPSLAWARVFLPFFFVPLLADVLRLRRVRFRPGWTDRHDPELPLPGPAARGGPLPFLLRVAVSDVLTLLSARGMRQVLRQVRGQALARRRTGGRGPTPTSYRQKAEYCLPFTGEWTVASGGTTAATSHSWEILSQRYAYDFVVVDAGGTRHRDDGSRPEHYHAYGRPILAPADGEVVGVVDGVRDSPSVGTGWLDWRTPSIAGNSVTIRHAEGEFSFLAHLIPGSIPVRPGQRVRRGTPVGRCGHSGHSTEPHLHFQVQDHPDFFQAVGLPVKFSSVRIDDGPRPERVYLRSGMRVRSDAEPPC